MDIPSVHYGRIPIWETFLPAHVCLYMAMM